MSPALLGIAFLALGAAARGCETVVVVELPPDEATGGMGGGALARAEPAECSLEHGDCAAMYGDGYACCAARGLCVPDDPLDCEPKRKGED